jgi:hypothetical protein
MISEAGCKELHLLKVPPFPMSGEFSMNNHFTPARQSNCKPSELQIIKQGGTSPVASQKMHCKKHSF